ncbi:thiamine pyrophosphate-binding protein [Psychromarinibacter sp. C21-152]|uniref:Thiamine pyrophosphate-binding protein n=1 Tax=Psychromarinibacter sediminicola TaxID=3033385 RepID=A0AAE3NRH5_9RHOB|nr:thiamine pyrophosphate-dependent enzyme [Psychromarinibacter sediminicola]MDF0599610.1 thiamine pyrophosphate-binding protein [Psychromarinibacter sediminicola]
MPKVYEELARALAAADQGPVFGLVGDANLYLVDCFIRAHGGDYVAAANENGAVLAALGYASVSGRVGVATVTHGPAVTNTLTALADGVRSGLPALLICGDTAVADRQNLQNIAQREAVLSTGAGFEQVHSAETARDDLIRAMRAAAAERRPYALNLPTDLQHETVAAAQGAIRIAPTPPAVVPQEGDDLHEAVAVLAAAKRPLVLAGRGACDAESRAALLRLADRLEAPLATTLKARELFRGEDWDLGIFGTLSAPGAVEAILQADCVISFGASLSSYTTSDGAYVEGKRVVQVSPRAADLGCWHRPDVAVLGDAAPTVEALLRWLDEAEIAPSGFRGELAPRGLGDFPAAEAPAEGLDCVAALSRLEALLPRPRTFVMDGGRHMINALQYVTAGDPQHYVHTTSFGAIGLGMAYAVGAAKAAPDRPAVLICGDGGFMLGGLAEFNTAVRHALDLTVVVANDGSYGAEHVQLRNKQMDPAVSLFAWPDIAPVAEALGGRGVTVRELADFAAVEAAIAEGRRPLLIELKLDPDRIGT